MSFRDSLGLTNEFLVVHSGNMGVKQGLDVILAAAELSRSDSGLQYLIVGDGAVRERLEYEARGRKLRNVRFLPLLPDDQYSELLTASDVSLITQQKCVADIVFPSKVITLMAAGQTIIASVNLGSEVAHVLNRARGGIVVPPEEPVSLLDAIGTLRRDSALRRKLAYNAREFARDNWDKEAILARLENRLCALVVDQPVKAALRRGTWNVFRSKSRTVNPQPEQYIPNESS